VINNIAESVRPVIASPPPLLFPNLRISANAISPKAIEIGDKMFNESTRPFSERSEYWEAPEVYFNIEIQQTIEVTKEATANIEGVAAGGNNLPIKKECSSELIYPA
jgi:hypothetical protein